MRESKHTWCGETAAVAGSGIVNVTGDEWMAPASEISTAE